MLKDAIAGGGGGLKSTLRVVKISRIHTQDDEYTNIVLQCKDPDIEIRINIKTRDKEKIKTFIGDQIIAELHFDQQTLQEGFE